MRNLPQYSKNAVCPKCRSKRIRSAFWAEGEGPIHCDFQRKDQDRITRTCENCHYDWDETPLDVKKDTK